MTEVDEIQLFTKITILTCYLILAQKQTNLELSSHISLIDNWLKLSNLTAYVVVSTSYTY